MSEPVFVVGHQRSGTTLLAAMLCAHSRLSCGPETQFFNTLADNDLTGAELTRDWPRAAVAFLLSVRHVGRAVPDNYGLSAKELENYLAGREPSVPAVLEALTELYMVRAGKARWVEKSPDHLPLVHLIRRWYPTAPVVRIVRDPRDVALSLLRAAWGPTTLRDELLRWNDWHDRSAGFFATDRLCCTVRYEDLLASPPGVLQGVCRLVGEDYEPGMLDTAEAFGHVNRTGEPWKANVGGPLDLSRVAVWKRELSDEENEQAVELLGARLSLYGYTRQRSYREEWLRTRAELDAARAELDAVKQCRSWRVIRALCWPLDLIIRRLRGAARG